MWNWFIERGCSNGGGCGNSLRSGEYVPVVWHGGFIGELSTGGYGHYARGWWCDSVGALGDLQVKHFPLASSSIPERAPESVRPGEPISLNPRGWGCAARDLGPTGKHLRMGDQITWRGYGGRVIQRARSTVVVEFGPIAQFKPIRGRFERNNPELLLVGRFTADRSLTGRPEAKS